MSSPPTRPPSVRQPGWVLLLGVLGVACLMMGLIMLAMLQAPVVRWGVILTSRVYIAAGLVLFSVAWFNRRRRHKIASEGPMTIKLELSPAQERAVDSLSRTTGRTPEQLVNDALDRLLDENDAVDWRSALRELEGLWEHRDDLPDFRQLRGELDRGLWSR